MNPDHFQLAWQPQTSQTGIVIDADLLLKEIRRSHQQFQAMIFWRDFREVAVAFVMIPVWIYLGVTLSLPWTWYLSLPSFACGTSNLAASQCFLAKSPPKGWEEMLIAAGSIALLFAVVFSINGFIYFLNQYAIRVQLEPRRQELLALLKSIGNANGTESVTIQSTGPHTEIKNDGLIPG